MEEKEIKIWLNHRIKGITFGLNHKVYKELDEINGKKLEIKVLQELEQIMLERKICLWKEN